MSIAEFESLMEQVLAAPPGTPVSADVKRRIQACIDNDAEAARRFEAVSDFITLTIEANADDVPQSSVDKINAFVDDLVQDRPNVDHSSSGGGDSDPRPRGEVFRISDFLRRQRVISAVGLLSAAAAVAFVFLLPDVPTARIASQAWGVTVDTRSGNDPDVLTGTDPFEYALTVSGKAGESWVTGVSLFQNGDIVRERLGGPDGLSIAVDGEFEIQIPPMVVLPNNLPTHLILLFTEHEMTEEKWNVRGPDSASEGESPSGLAERLCVEFDAESTILELRIGQ